MKDNSLNELFLLNSSHSWMILYKQWLSNLTFIYVTLSVYNFCTSESPWMTYSWMINDCWMLILITTVCLVFFYCSIEKRGREGLQNCSLDVPRKQIYFGVQYKSINESSVKFVQNISKLISKIFNYIKCIPYFKKGRNLLSYFSSKIKNLI